MKNTERFFVGASTFSTWLICDSLNKGLPLQVNEKGQDLTFGHCANALTEATRLNALHTCDECQALFEPIEADNDFCSEACLKNHTE